MKTLVLLRHAKSDRSDPAWLDKERPLAARGQSDAPRMGAWLAAQEILLDRVLVSPAVRTRQTWALVQPQLKAPPEADIRDDLYHAAALHLLAVARATPPTLHAVLLVGHNPGFEELATMLAGRGAARLRAALAEKFPSGACAILTVDSTTWTAFEPDAAELSAFMVPRRLAG